MFVRHHGSQRVGEAERLSSNARGVNMLGMSDQETQAATSLYCGTRNDTLIRCLSSLDFDAVKL